MIKNLINAIFLFGFFQPAVAGLYSININTEEKCNSVIKSECKNKYSDVLVLKKEAYEKAYDDFYMNLVDNKKNIKNFNDVIDNIEQAEDLWRSYIVKECSAEASLKKEYSDEYLLTYQKCMARHYDKKRQYYRRFKLE